MNVLRIDPSMKRLIFVDREEGSTDRKWHATVKWDRNQNKITGNACALKPFVKLYGLRDDNGIVMKPGQQASTLVISTYRDSAVRAGQPSHWVSLA